MHEDQLILNFDQFFFQGAAGIIYFHCTFKKTEDCMTNDKATK